MNHIYRIVWNYSAACWQAVSEIGKGKHKVKASQSAKADKTNVGKMRASSLPAQIVSRIRPLALLVSLVSAGVLAAPTGGKVSVGQAEISQQGSVTHIHQASHSAAINWQNFNVKPQETVNFHQPSRESVTLNRVIGNERAVIEGAINAPGNVFISNPNGVLIGNGAQINVGSLVATTAQIRDEDFIKGNYQFAGKGNGKIENLSNITVPKGGVVALIAPIVKNQGKIHATDGQVLLASAQAFRISLPNEQFQYTVKQGVLQGLVENGGAILAPNGRVVLTAKGISAVKKSVIKHSGVIEANRVRNQGGVVELLGDLDHSELHLTGEIKAEGKGKADGGSVETSAAKLNIGHNAKVSTQSAQGKTGNWVLDPKDFTVAKSGGDITGAQVAQHLKSSNLELKSRSGAKEGKGDVIINDSISWQQNTLTLNADNDVRINKTLNGEGSAKLALKVGQSTADGGGADFLLEDGVKMDKRTVRINLPVGQNFSLQRGSAGKVETFEVLHDLPKDGYFRARNIAIGKDIDLANRGALPFSGWSFFLTEKQQKEGYSHFYGLGHHINNLTINSGGYHSGLLKYLGNGGGEIRDLKLHNANVIGSSSGILVSLATTTIKNIYTQGSVSGDAEAGGIAGSINGNLINVMSDVVVSAKYSAGGIVGAAHGSIKNATVRGSITSTSGYNTGGVAGYADTISHSEVQADINGIRNVGGLAGRASHITDSHFSGTVLAKENKVGGLVGELRSNGKIIKSYVTDSDIQAGGDSVGGLAGISERSSSTQFSYIDNQSEVRGATSVGGLIGHAASESNVVNSYALAQVRGNEKVGGLVGSSFNALSITHSYAAGLVHSSNSSSAGGLVGLSEVEKGKKRETLVLALNSYYDKDKTQQSKSVVGDAKSSSEMHKQKTFRRWDFDRIWRIDENNDYPRLRALTKGVVVINPEQPPSPEKPTPEPEPEKPVEEPKKPLSTVKAVDLSKTYDGKAVNTLGDLKKLQGWKGNGVTISGLQAGDTVANSFSGEVNFDGEKSNWKGAKNVKEGGYILDPRGLQSQKYEIQWGTGRLNINKKPLKVITLNNFMDDFNDFTKNIGVVADGLVNGEKIDVNKIKFTHQEIVGNNDNEYSYFSNKIFPQPNSIVISNGKIENYDVTVQPGKIIWLPKEKRGEPLNKRDLVAYAKVLEDNKSEMVASQLVYLNSANAKLDTQKIKRYVNELNNSKDTSFEYLGGYDGNADLQMVYFKDNSKPNKYIISYRGTEGARDWATNLATMVKVPDAYIDSKLKTKEWIAKIKKQDPKAEIVFTGHSLGGSLAQYNMIHLDGKNRAVTFNSAPIRPILLEGISKSCSNNIKNCVKGSVHFKFDDDILEYIKPLALKKDKEYLGEVKHLKVFTKSPVLDHLNDHIRDVYKVSRLVYENEQLKNKYLVQRDANYSHLAMGSLKSVGKKLFQSSIAYGAATVGDVSEVPYAGMRRVFGEKKVEEETQSYWINSALSPLLARTLAKDLINNNILFDSQSVVKTMEKNNAEIFFKDNGIDDVLKNMTSFSNALDVVGDKTLSKNIDVIKTKVLNELKNSKVNFKSVAKGYVINVVKSIFVKYLVEDVLFGQIKDLCCKDKKGMHIDVMNFLVEVAKPIANEFAQSAADALIDSKSLNPAEFMLRFKTKVITNLSLFTIQTSVKAFNAYHEGKKEHKGLVSSYADGIMRNTLYLAQADAYEKAGDKKLAKTIRDIALDRDPKFVSSVKDEDKIRWGIFTWYQYGDINEINRNLSQIVKLKNENKTKEAKSRLDVLKKKYKSNSGYFKDILPELGLQRL